MKSQHSGTHLLPNTTIEVYVVRAKISKVGSVKIIDKTIFIESLFSHAKHLSLLASLIKFQEYEKVQDFEDILHGLVCGRAISYVSETDKKIILEDYDYLTQKADKDAAVQDSEYLTMKDIFSAVFELIKRGAIKDYTRLPIFLKLRNYDEEFAAMIKKKPAIR